MKKERNCTSPIAIITFLSLLATSSYLANSQSDSCASQLAVSGLIPFATSSLKCSTAWSRQDFILRFENNGQTNVSSFVLSAPDTSAYIGMGFSSGGRMVGSNAVVGWIGGGGAGTVKRYYLGGKSSVECVPDTGNLQLVADTTMLVAQSSRFYLAFQLEGGRAEANLIFSVGPRNRLPSSDYYLAEHREAESTSVDYTTGSVRYIRIGGFSSKRVHGLMVMLGWGILIPLGVMTARYMKHLDPLWFYAHISIQLIGFGLGMIGIILGFRLTYGEEGNVGAHRAIGICIFIVGFLQVIALVARPNKSSKVRKYWNWYHHNTGRAGLVLAVANIFFGFSLVNEANTWRISYLVCLSLFFVISALLELINWRKHGV